LKVAVFFAARGKIWCRVKMGGIVRLGKKIEEIVKNILIEIQDIVS